MTFPTKQYGVIYVATRDSHRMLTVTEAESLQTLPHNYTEGVSNTQRYKALGNGWTVDVVAHLFKFLPPPNNRKGMMMIKEQEMLITKKIDELIDILKPIGCEFDLPWVDDEGRYWSCKFKCEEQQNEKR